MAEAQHAAAVVEPKIDLLYDMLKTGEKDRQRLDQAPLAGRLRPVDGQGAGRKGADRWLQRDAGQGQAGMRFQQPKNDTWQLGTVERDSPLAATLEKLARDGRDVPARAW